MSISFLPFPIFSSTKARGSLDQTLSDTVIDRIVFDTAIYIYFTKSITYLHFCFLFRLQL